jgi:hypothetical protein
MGIYWDFIVTNGDLMGLCSDKLGFTYQKYPFKFRAIRLVDGYFHPEWMMIHISIVNPNIEVSRVSLQPILG